MWPFIVSVIWPPIKHAIARFGSVIAVALVIGLAFFLVRSYIKNHDAKVCAKCISEWMKEHPTYGNVGTVNNNTVKTAGFELNGFGLGVWHRR